MTALPDAARADDHAGLSLVNRHLATLARSSPAAAQSIPAAIGVAHMQPSIIAAATNRPLPWRVPIGILRLTHAERALHIKTQSLDANFWGMLGPGHSASLKLHFTF